MSSVTADVPQGSSTCKNSMFDWRAKIQPGISIQSRHFHIKVRCHATEVGEDSARLWVNIAESFQEKRCGFAFGVYEDINVSNEVWSADAGMWKSHEACWPCHAANWHTDWQSFLPASCLPAEVKECVFCYWNKKCLSALHHQGGRFTVRMWGQLKTAIIHTCI